jgi:Rab GDP dissociation inhibitor
VSANHDVAPKDYYIAIVSTIVETSVPERELIPGLQLIGNVVDKFVTIEPIYEPMDDGRMSQAFITKSYDATSHLETVVDDVRDVWERLTGAPLVVKKVTTDITANDEE